MSLPRSGSARRSFRSLAGWIRPGGPPPPGRIAPGGFVGNAPVIALLRRFVGWRRRLPQSLLEILDLFPQPLDPLGGPRSPVGRPGGGRAGVFLPPPRPFPGPGG